MVTLLLTHEYPVVAWAIPILLRVAYDILLMSHANQQRLMDSFIYAIECASITPWYNSMNNEPHCNLIMELGIRERFLFRPPRHDMCFTQHISVS